MDDGDGATSAATRDEKGYPQVKRASDLVKVQSSYDG